MVSHCKKGVCRLTQPVRNKQTSNIIAAVCLKPSIMSICLAPETTRGKDEHATWAQRQEMIYIQTFGSSSACWYLCKLASLLLVAICFTCTVAQLSLVLLKQQIIRRLCYFSRLTICFLPYCETSSGLNRRPPKPSIQLPTERFTVHSSAH